MILLRTLRVSVMIKLFYERVSHSGRQPVSTMFAESIFLRLAGRVSSLAMATDPSWLTNIIGVDKRDETLAGCKDLGRAEKIR
jgi:hypothetical protein